MARTIRILLVSLLASLALAGAAQAAGGNYVVDGGTPAEQAQVKAALDASSFDWGVVPARIAIHVVRGGDSYASPGEIWLDADLLDAGRFAWATVQHEYAHQVDFLLLDDAKRALLQRALGTAAWCGEGAHEAQGCERFASLVAWAYWPSRDNALRPESSRDEAGAMPAGAFRALLGSLLRAPRAT